MSSLLIKVWNDQNVLCLNVRIYIFLNTLYKIFIGAVQVKYNFKDMPLFIILL